MGDKIPMSTDDAKLVRDANQRRIARGEKELTADESRALIDAVTRAEKALNAGNEKSGELEAVRLKASQEVDKFNERYDQEMAGDPTGEPTIEQILAAPAQPRTLGARPAAPGQKVTSPTIEEINKLLGDGGIPANAEQLNSNHPTGLPSPTKPKKNVSDKPAQRQ